MATKRQYLTIDELQEFADITVIDENEAFDQIGQAEEIIDAYVGPQDRFIKRPHVMQVSAANGKTLSDIHSTSPLNQFDDYFAGCMMEVIGGTGAGQSRRISSSSETGKSITYEGDDLNPAVDTTSIIKIYQLAKYPRCKDVETYGSTRKYFKSIPEAVRRATAAQVAFMINQGADFFDTDKLAKQSERLGNYSYTNSQGAMSGTAVTRIVSPRAKALLRGYKNNTGRLLSDNQSCL